MDKARAVDWMLKAASGTTVCIDRELTSTLLIEIERLMDHWHPNPDGSDYRCEFCGNSPCAVWNPERHEYEQMRIVHGYDCLGTRAQAAFTAALGT